MSAPAAAFPIALDAYVLALDAATYDGSVAVSRGGTVLAEETVAMRGEHEERLLPAVERALAAAGVDVSALGAVVCGAGPGSFTSLRIAASIAKGIAAARDLPLLAVASPLLVAAGLREAVAPGAWLVLLDAQRGEFFGTAVALDGAGVPEQAAPTRIVSAAEHAAIVVAGVPRLLGAGAVGDAPQRPHARGVARLVAAGGTGLARVALDAWEPDYGRLAEAQVRWEAEHGRALTPHA